MGSGYDMLEHKTYSTEHGGFVDKGYRVNMDKLREFVDGRIERRVAGLERDLAQTRRDLADAEEALANYAIRK